VRFQLNTFVTDLRARLLDAFVATYGGMPDVIARAPGRVNLIGEHTDYNDGFVLPMAIDRQTMVAARGRDDGMIRLHAVDLASHDQFSVQASIQPEPSATWSNYIRGVAHALIADGLALSGADIAIAGDVPHGAGLSSSASLEVAVGLALAALAGQPDYDRTMLALAGQRAEHDFAGCKCGIMDQLVSAHGIAGHASLIDCRTFGVTSVPVPTDWAVMIVHSGQERGLVDGEYNVRRLQCELAAGYFKAKALRDVSLDALCNARSKLEPLVYARAHHVVTENARVLSATVALRKGDLAAIGELMAQSHISMRDDFAITTPTIDALVAQLQAAIGPNGGARMTGGGFGGAVVAIMRSAETERVHQIIARGFRDRHGKEPLIIFSRPIAGAALITSSIS
jgi:galactokinase